MTAFFVTMENRVFRPATMAQVASLYLTAAFPKASIASGATALEAITSARRKPREPAVIRFAPAL
jgi:hypothetical protein